MKPTPGAVTSRPAREPKSWVPEEHIITPSYPVFAEHLIQLPVPGALGAQCDLGRIVTRACRDMATEQRHVTGGGTRREVPARPIEESSEYTSMMDRLGYFAFQRDVPALDAMHRLLDEYPKNEGTDYLRRILDAIETAYCKSCAGEFKVRHIHACDPSDVRNKRTRDREFRTRMAGMF